MQAGRDDREEVNAAAQFAQGHHVAVRASRPSVRRAGSGVARRERGAVDVIDDRLGGAVERIEAVDAGELRVAELGGAAR